MLCVFASAAFGQQAFRWQSGNAYSDTMTVHGYRYKSMGFNNVFVAVAEGKPLHYGFRKFASFLLLVSNEDKEKRLELERANIVCECASGKTLFVADPRKLPFPAKEVFAGETVFPGDDYKGIVLFDGDCGSSAKTITVRIGATALEYPF